MKDNFLSWVYFQRGEVSVLSGYSPRRYRTFVDLTILNRIMDYKLKTQRTIGIIDTEVNQIKKNRKKYQKYNN